MYMSYQNTELTASIHGGSAGSVSGSVSVIILGISGVSWQASAKSSSLSNALET